MRGMNMTRLVAAAVAIVTCGSAARAQTIRVGEIVTVARETDPRRFAEPHLAVHPGNPNHFLAASFIGWTAGTPQEESDGQRCATFMSVNAGATWTRHDFPNLDCADPQVAILPDGQAVFVAMAKHSGLRPDRGDWLLVFHSNDAGVTWDDVPTTLGWRFDHPAITVDRTSSTRRGWIYISAHFEFRDGNAQMTSAVFVARSRDGGKSFDVPAMPSPTPLHNFGEMPVVLSDGTLVASFVDDTWTRPSLERRRAWVIRSVDGATTFSPALLVNDVCGRPPTFQLSALAVDASDGPSRDRLYFACRQSGGGSVVVTASGNRGDTWNRPGVVVGSSPVDVDARRVMTIGVNNRGVVGILWVERRTKSGAQCLVVNFSVSTDGGATFVTAQPVSTSACGDSTNDEVSWRRFPTYGDYFGLVSLPNGNFRLMWAEMRGGSSVLLTTTVAVDAARTP